MQFNYFIGIDVSKETLDICVLCNNKVVSQQQIKNSPKAIQLFLKNLSAQSICMSQCLWCLEHTGVYIHLLVKELLLLDAKVWVENPSQIKLSQGLTRGKNDKIDAKRIAEYASSFHYRAKLYTPKRLVLVKLKKLSSLRFQLQNTKVALEKSIAETARFLGKQTAQTIKSSSRKTRKALAEEIKEIELKMILLIKEDEELNKLYHLVTSVDGIGLQTATAILITTNAFSEFNNPKKYACYAGVAPFEHQSGKSLKTRPRVSQKANKEVKKLLHMAALTVLKIPGSEFAKYYERKKKEGKNGMTIINAIRAKLIARVFACVRDNRKYQKENFYQPLVLP